MVQVDISGFFTFSFIIRQKFKSFGDVKDASVIQKKDAEGI